jgi:hypothetical protein
MSAFLVTFVDILTVVNVEVANVEVVNVEVVDVEVNTKT